MQTDDKLTSGTQNHNNDGALTRRTFLSAAGLAGISGALAACSTGQDDGLEDQPDANSVTNSVMTTRIMPASSYAQSVLLALMPQNVISLAADIAPQESSPGFDVSAAPVTGPMMLEGINSFKELASDLNAALIVDISYGADEKTAGLSEICKQIGSESISIDLNNRSALDAFRFLIEELSTKGVEVDPARIGSITEVTQSINQILAAASSLPENDRLKIFLGAGESGFGAYGSDTAIGRMTSLAGCELYSVAPSPNSMNVTVDSDPFLSSNIPDVVFLIDKEAGVDFLNEGGITSMWGITDTGKNECVFPGLAGDVMWIGSMTAFEQETIGAAWLASLLYPNVTEAAPADLVSSFYSNLYSINLPKDEESERVDALFDKTLPIDKEAIKEQTDKRNNQRASDAQALQQNLYDANNPDNYTDEELLEQFDAMCRAMGKEPTEEMRQGYLKSIRNL